MYVCVMRRPENVGDCPYHANGGSMCPMGKLISRIHHAREPSLAVRFLQTSESDA